MSTDDTHPDFENLSAHFDGEAPEVAAHVVACAECRTKLKWLRMASSLVATPVPSPPTSVRDQALARAAALFESMPKTAEGAGGPAEATDAGWAAGGPSADTASTASGIAPGASGSGTGAGGSVSPTVRPAAASRPGGSVGGAGDEDDEAGAGLGRVGAAGGSVSPTVRPAASSRPGGSVGGAGGEDDEAGAGLGRVGAAGGSVSPAVRPAAASRPAGTGRAAAGGPGAFRPVDAPRPAPAPIPITAGRRNRTRGGSGLWVGVGSAAAVIVAVIVGVSALGGGGGRDTDTLAAGPTQERTTTLFAGGAAGGAATAGVPDTDTSGGVNAGDIGDIPDTATLVARARPVLTQRSAALAAPAAPIAGAGQESRAPDLTDIVPKAVGTRPCEMEARAARPGLGTVVYFATGQVGGVPVIVLGFEPGLPPAGVTLLALAQPEGCRIVLEAAGP